MGCIHVRCICEAHLCEEKRCFFVVVFCCCFLIQILCGGLQLCSTASVCLKSARSMYFKNNYVRLPLCV